MARKIFLQVNRKYFEYGPDDQIEKFKRKYDEFGYMKIDPIHLVELTMELVEMLVFTQIEKEQAIKDYKLINDCDEESRDYLWLIQKSERDMR
jgi:hypothetical protein